MKDILQLARPYELGDRELEVNLLSRPETPIEPCDHVATLAAIAISQVHNLPHLSFSWGR